MTQNFGANPSDGLGNARRNALGALTAAATSDDPGFIKNYLKTVIAEGGQPLQALIELLGGMTGIARILIEIRQEEGGHSHDDTLRELGRRVAPAGE